jgi:hypothetical protein
VLAGRHEVMTMHDRRYNSPEDDDDERDDDERRREEQEERRLERYESENP